MPPGVLNIVNGPGGEIGEALATNPRVAKIAFNMDRQGRVLSTRLVASSGSPALDQEAREVVMAVGIAN